LKVILLAEKDLVILKGETIGPPKALDQDHDDRVEEKERQQQEQNGGQDVDQICIQEILDPASAAGL
jgi:hypothetical protein